MLKIVAFLKMQRLVLLFDMLWFFNLFNNFEKPIKLMEWGA